VALPDDDDGYPGRFERSDDLLRVVVPDDLRELDADVAAYHRELEHLRRQQRRQLFWHRFTPRWARGGLPSPVFTAVLLVVATTGLLLSVFAPVSQQSQNALNASSLAHPTQAAGTPGGLLPDVQLAADNRQIGTRVIRPAVLVLIPAKCDCAALIRQIVGQANEEPPNPYIVLVSAGSDTTAAKLADAKDGGHGVPVPVRDPKGVLARTYKASSTAPTLLFVKADGVTSAPRTFHDGDRLESALAEIRS
jgi:hypothetical protein